MPLDPSIYGITQNPLSMIAESAKLKSQLLQQQLGRQQLQQGNIEIQQKQRDATAQSALNDAMRTAVTTGSDGNPVFDKQAISQHLASSGAGHLIPQVMEHLQKIDAQNAEIQKNRAESQKWDQETRTSQTDYAGMGGLAIRDMGYDPQAALGIIAHGLATKNIDQQTANALTQKIVQSPNAQTVQQLVDPLISQSPKAQDALEKRSQGRRAEAGASMDAANQDKVQKLLPGELALQAGNLTKIGQETTGTVPLTAKDKFQQQVEAARLRNEQARTGIERSRLGLESQRNQIAAAQADPFGQYGVNKNPAAAGAQGETGQSFLQKLPPGMAGTVKAIAEGRQAPIEGFALTKGPGQAIMAAVNQYDPQWSRQKAEIRKAFTTGTDGRNIGALNTATVHTDQGVEALRAVANGSFKPGNALYNSFADTFGATAPNDAAAVANAMAGEIASALKGNATDPEIAAVKATIPTNGSPQQIEGWAKKQLHILGAKLNTYQERYSQQIPGDTTYSPVLPSARAVFAKNGINPTAGPRANISPAGGRRKSLDEIFK